MGFILTKAGLYSVRLNLIKGFCDTCRGCRAWDKPGRTVMPSTALPGKFNEEISNATSCLTNRNIIYFTSSIVVFALLLEWRYQKRQ
eukprot:9032626-Pyramimonas_sp.AAC.1